jgi:hypothetical protein
MSLVRAFVWKRGTLLHDAKRKPYKRTTREGGKYQCMWQARTIP